MIGVLLDTMRGLLASEKPATWGELAVRLGVTNSAISNWRGGRAITLARLQGLLTAWNADPVGNRIILLLDGTEWRVRLAPLESDIGWPEEPEGEVYPESEEDLGDEAIPDGVDPWA